MKKINLLLVGALLIPTLIFMAPTLSHGVTGTYISCVHGCPDLIDCNNCCNETFRSILGACDAKRDQCEALCPPGDMDCLDACVMTRNDCLMQDMRDFDCPHWRAGGPQPGLTRGGSFLGLMSAPAPKSSGQGCAYCH